MVISAILLKAALPVVIAVGGVSAYALAPSAAGSPHVSAAWIDAPLGGTNVQPGTIVVLAHASATKSITSMTLDVDGHPVTTTSSLQRDGGLVYARLDWQAVAGDHKLVATAGGNANSAPVLVTVGPANILTPTPSSSPTASATTAASPPATATPSQTPTASPSTPVTTSASSTSPPPTPVTTSASSTSPPPSTSPASPPVIGTARVAPTQIAWGDCSETNTKATVTATITGATSAHLLIDGTTLPMTQSGTTWTGPFDVSLSSFGQPGDRYTNQTYPITIYASNATGIVQASAGTISIQACKP